MAAANVKQPITLNPFRGKPDENWPDFESLLRSVIDVGKNEAANQPQFLLHSNFIYKIKHYISSELYRKQQEITSIHPLQPSEAIFVTQTSKNYTNYNFKFWNLTTKPAAQKTSWFKHKSKQHKRTLTQYLLLYHQQIHQMTMEK